MNNRQEPICKEFNAELFLYIDNELPKEKMEFYRTHLSYCAECRLNLNEVNLISSIASEEICGDVLDAKFDKMIERATAKSKISIKSFFFPARDSQTGFGMAFRVLAVAAVTVIAILFSLSTKQPNPVKNISKDLLDWDGDKIDAQIYELSKGIMKVENTQWENNIQLIDRELKNLEKVSDEKTF